MKKAPVSQGMIGVDWTAFRLPWDPYLIWQDITAQLPTADELGERPDSLQPIEFVSVIVETTLNPGGQLRRLRRNYGTHPGWLETSRAVAERARSDSTVFGAVQVDNDSFKDLLDAATDASSGLLRLELSRPRQYLVPLGSDRKDFRDRVKEFLRSNLLFNFDFKSNIPQNFKAPAPGPMAAPQGLPAPAPLALQPSGVSLCIIDDRCNFAAWPEGTVRMLWDQSPVDAPGVTAVGRSAQRSKVGKGFAARLRSESVGTNLPQAGKGPGEETPVILGGYGRERSFGAGRDDPSVARRSARVLSPLASDEALEYRESQYFTPLRRWSHGSAILSALASGLAAPSGIHFVQLPAGTVLDTAGGSLAGHALDAILDAAAHARGSRHLVVNLSFGTHSGPHDGSSMFERALLQLLNHFDGNDGRPELHVVLPAGNTQRWRCHSSAWLHGGHRKHTMHWRVLPDNPDCSFVEVWLSQPSVALQVRVRPPHGDVITVTPGTAQCWQTDQDGVPTVHGAVIFGREVSQGCNGTMALVAAAPTQPGAYTGPERAERTERNRTKLKLDLGSAPHGVWTIEVELPESAPPTRVDAWVQRGDAAPARARDANGFDGRQSYFLDTTDGGPDPEVTLNGIACASHRRLWVVGARRSSDGGLADYGSAGPARPPADRAEGPDVVEAVDASLALPGLLVQGARTGGRLRISGTSIAAALFSRRLYHRLERGVDPQALRHGSRHHVPTQDPPASPGSPAMADPVFRGDYRRLNAEPQGRLEADLRLARQLARD